MLENRDCNLLLEGRDSTMWMHSRRYRCHLNRNIYINNLTTKPFELSSFHFIRSCSHHSIRLHFKLRFCFGIWGICLRYSFFFFSFHWRSKCALATKGFAMKFIHVYCWICNVLFSLFLLALMHTHWIYSMKRLEFYSILFS